MIPEAQTGEGQGLARGLRARHVQLIAIGGTIGVGLFLGSAQAIHRAGPGLLIGYAIAGVAIFFIMRALGELMLHRPVTGSFVAYAHDYVSPFAGFITGWSYWFMWVVDAMAVVTAIGIYMTYWFPALPQWVPALIALVILYSSNLLAVRVFGELEFWFAMIKLVTIVGLIAIGLVIIFFGVGDLGQQASFSNLWSHGGFTPFGIVGVLLTLQMVTFAYSGVELIGVTAGEAENPSVVLPRATNTIIFRILIFYIGSLVVIMSLLPWTELDPNTSPFVVVFDKIGIAGAAGLVNLVVITAAASSCNSGIYSAGRMLYALASKGHAPRTFTHVNRRHVPVRGVTASFLLMLIGVGLNYAVPDRVFVWLTSIALTGTLCTWLMIMLAHRRYRIVVKRGLAEPVAFRMPGAPFSNWFVIGFLCLVVVMMGIDPQTRIALYVAGPWFAILAVSYLYLRRAARRAEIDLPHTPAYLAMQDEAAAEPAGRKA